MKNNVNSIIVGMSRAGTSFLYHNLQKHPQIFLPSRKEVCFFAHNYRKGIHWYNNFFSNKKKSHIGIDICGVYFTHEATLKRLLNLKSNPKIILCVRDPYDWIYSFYEQYSGNFKMPSLMKFIKSGCEIEREGEKIIDFRNEKISNRIDEYISNFKGRLMIYDFSLFEKDPLLVLSKMEEFLGIEKWFNDSNFSKQRINASGRKKFNFFNKLLQKKGFINLLLFVFPKKIILKLRERWELSEAKNIKRTDLQKKYPKNVNELVIKSFKQDHLFYKALFREKKIIYPK
jgi:hypothetical protein